MIETFRRYSSTSFFAALLTLAAISIFAASQALDIPMSQADGAYQTASGLFRLAASEIPGADFFPYLGTGLLYVLYLPYRIAGGDMASTVFAGYLITSITTCLGLGISAALLDSKKPLRATMYVTLISLLIVTAFFSDLPPWASSRIIPGNSLRPLRSFIPYICAGFALLTLKSNVDDNRKAMLLCGISALATVWSNDYGVPTALLFGLFALFWSVRKLGRKWIFLTPALSLALAFILLFTVTAGHPIKLIQYNLAVSSEQYWYYACWDRSCRILNFSDYYRNFFRPAVGWWWLVVPLIVSYAIVVRSLTLTLLALLGLCLLAGGSIAAIGGHIEFDYASAFLLWCQSIVVLVLIVVAIRWIPSQALSAGITLAAVFGLHSAWQFYARAKQERINNPQLAYSASLGGFVPIPFKNHVGISAANGEAILEDYWGLWSAANHTTGKYPVDSVIHAFGFVRERYSEALEKINPTHVITADPQYLGFFRGWMISANWWFYGRLFRNYESAISTPTTLLWSRTGEREWPAVSCSVSDGRSLVVNDGHIGYYDIELKYRSKLNHRKLLFIRNNLNYAADAGGYLSIPPKYDGHIKFPAAVLRTGEALDTKSFKNRQDYILEACFARKLVTDAPRYFPPLEPNGPYTPLDLTDGNWINGIHRVVPAFLLRNDEVMRAKLRVGTVVQFFNGRSETVTALVENNPYLEVHLSGVYPLEGGQGFPRQVILPH
ncbi:MAG: hypothetical protein PGN26_08115 [Xylophilus ampelinus]